MTTTSAPYSVTSDEGHFDERGHYVYHNLKRKERFACAYPTNGQIFIQFETQAMVKEGIEYYLRSVIAEVFQGRVKTEITTTKNGYIIKWGAR